MATTKAMRFAAKPLCGHDPIHVRKNGECRHVDCPEGNRNGLEPEQQPAKITLADSYKIDAVLIRDTVWMNHTEQGDTYGRAEVGHRQGTNDTWIYKVKTPDDAVELARQLAELFGCPIKEVR